MQISKHINVSMLKIIYMEATLYTVDQNHAVITIIYRSIK